MPRKNKQGAQQKSSARRGERRRAASRIAGGTSEVKRQQRERRRQKAMAEGKEVRVPRVTAQGKPFTKRARTAAELGLEPAGPAEVQGKIPVVAIVGRPNVGKSSLFNRLAGSRIAIEDPRPGTTRDRISTLVKLGSGGEERVVELFDTAGVGVVDEAQVEEHVHEQIDNGIASADVVLMVTDVKDGVLPLDRTAAGMLRRANRRVILVVNKADDPGHDNLVSEFHALGLGEPLPVSAKGRRRIKELVAAVREHLPPKSAAERLDPPELLLAIVGRRNVGKSTLVNFLAQDERVIASELEGTTRDSVDVRFQYDGRTFVAIDTAGIRKRQSVEHSVEYFSQSRSIRAVRRASVTVLMIDARESITKLDRQLAEEAVKEQKPVILAVNKWDLTDDSDPEEYQKYLRKKLGVVDFAPIVFLSAKSGLNALALVDIARELHAQSGFRIGTGELNRLVHEAFERHHPQPRKNKLGKIYYATQTGVYPPVIVVFVNDPTLFPENWRTYLMHKLQEQTPYAEVPLRLKFKARKRVLLDE